MGKVNIQKAVMKAVAMDGHITRTSWCKHVYVKPTNLPEKCFVVTQEGKWPRWEPGAEELMAEDWEVVTTKELTLPFQHSPGHRQDHP